MGRPDEASCRAALDRLERSGALSPEGPKRVHLSHAELASMSVAARLEAQRRETAAGMRVPDPEALAHEIATLMDARYEPATPTLARIWADCPHSGVRLAAGRALAAIGSPEALAALATALDEASFSTGALDLAIRSVFDAAPERAFDVLGPRFDAARLEDPGGCEVPAGVLWLLGGRSFTADGGWQWMEANAPRWFDADSRWLDLCARLRRHPILGEPARDAMGHADSARITQAVQRAREEELAIAGPPRTRAAGDLLSRYRRGEHLEVWTDIRGAGAIRGDYREEVLAVARETMARVAANVDRVAERLASKGWRAFSGRFRTPPSASDPGWVAQAEAATGAPLPPSLLAFWEVGGGVDLVWDYRQGPAPDLELGVPLDEQDPLNVETPAIVEELAPLWEDERAQAHPDLVGPFRLDLAPDYLHKADISGGEPYHVLLPFEGADPVLEGERHRLPFVDYLRLCFRWGGFPRLEAYAERDGVRGFVAWMTADLEAF